MASPLYMFNRKYPVRSISLPSRSHPTTLKIEDELNKLKLWEATSTLSFKTIGTGLSGLEEAYGYLDELLNMSSTQQVLSQNKQEKFINELLDSSVQQLDVCGVARDLVLQVKEHVQTLQSVLRRRKGDLSIETRLLDYANFRKKAKKDAKRLSGALKQMESRFAPLVNQDDHFLAVMKVLRETGEFSISIFQSILGPFSGPVSSPKESRWLLISRLIHKGVMTCKERQESENELQYVDDALSILLKNISWDEPGAENVRIVQKQLKDLEKSLGSLDEGLESIFRQLIRSRTSLLNIISQ
ncbi:uncharacterized protein LOC115736434 [Rhodamnia argentea]|uniref:Uncharacterized protein LOC115736434 n=1 Tax=Rhodamnia argentea TaxID=178133 RepID=A0A8B8NNC3_9MYRT|nr:uncharacterized protein LOC115736434 [Rhodamnia argentea]